MKELPGVKHFKNVPTYQVCCFICGPADVEFDIVSQQESQAGYKVGCINRKWQLMGAALNADMDRFSVTMPPGADLKAGCRGCGQMRIYTLYFLNETG